MRCYTNETDGLEARVIDSDPKGFKVIFRDTDADQIIEIRIYDSFVKARDYALTLIA